MTNKFTVNRSMALAAARTVAAIAPANAFRNVLSAVVGIAVAEAPKGTRRPLKPPGTFYEYNDVRVNRLSLCLLRLFKEPLPSVLKRRIMDPIGASSTWKWDGYRNSTVAVDGKEMVSVPGGGHWGGGIVISARDLALMGLLVARDGTWDGKEILHPGWTDELVKPCPVAPFYGLMPCAASLRPISSPNA